MLKTDMEFILFIITVSELINVMKVRRYRSKASTSFECKGTEMDFCLFILTISALINIVKGAGCLYSYYECTGYNWCCPNGYYCTGTSICNANPYSSSYSSSFSYSRIGYIVGGCIAGVVILICIIVAVCKSSSKSGRVIAPPAIQRTILEAENIASQPPSYNDM
ncbi:uncharacterized protein LOC134712791 [Mytilus trossulus]|uniref:uncharacterized protein LOC134712791 n=1 Tax=Mytilus trossulus TaxID=6551 RepID=UPI0030076596